jgi:hypothetical protein
LFAKRCSGSMRGSASAMPSSPGGGLSPGPSSL